MSNLVYPSIGNFTTPGSPSFPPDLPGITLNVTRAPVFNTAVQTALSGKESRIAYQLYPLLEWTLEYEVLRDAQAVSELITLKSFFMQMGGQYDSFLFEDPWFNSVTNNLFAFTDGTTTAFQLTALYTNDSGTYAGVGKPEIIQNLNGPPFVYLDRYQLNELLSPVSRTNYILQSQAFGTGWTLVNATVTSNTTVAPDGTTTGDSLLETTSTTQHHVQRAATVPGAVQPWTFSVFINPGLTRTWAQLQLFENTGVTAASAYFNLSGPSGAVGNIANGTNWSAATATITACANGWYRCTLTAQNTNSATGLTANVNAATANGTNSYTGVVTDGLILWGAQLEQTSAATLYLPTTGATVTQTDYVLGGAGVITTNVTFPGGASLNWTGQFYYRVRFDDDTLDFTQIAGFANAWEMKKVKLRQIKL